MKFAESRSRLPGEVAAGVLEAGGRSYLLVVGESASGSGDATGDLRYVIR
jgi:hypothetical protein